MNSFKSKYPAFTALLALLGSIAVKAVKSGESLIQKIEDEATLLPQALAFYPSASALSAELAGIKASPTDMEGGIEVLVTDLSLSSDKAQALMPKVFVLAEKMAECVKPAEDVFAALKA